LTGSASLRHSSRASNIIRRDETSPAWSNRPRIDDGCLNSENPMPNIDLIDSYAAELTAIRRDLHAHPEIGFEEKRTSAIIARKLEDWGIEVHRGIGGTGSAW
jgi:hypothetical protein